MRNLITLLMLCAVSPAGAVDCLALESIQGRQTYTGAIFESHAWAAVVANHCDQDRRVAVYADALDSGGLSLGFGADSGTVPTGGLVTFRGSITVPLENKGQVVDYTAKVTARQ